MSSKLFLLVYGRFFVHIMYVHNIRNSLTNIHNIINYTHAYKISTHIIVHL